MVFAVFGWVALVVQVVVRVCDNCKQRRGRSRSITISTGTRPRTSRPRPHVEENRYEVIEDHFELEERRGNTSSTRQNSSHYSPSSTQQRSQREAHMSSAFRPLIIHHPSLNEIQTSDHLSLPSSLPSTLPPPPPPDSRAEYLPLMTTQQNAAVRGAASASQTAAEGGSAATITPEVLQRQYNRLQPVSVRE